MVGLNVPIVTDCVMVAVCVCVCVYLSFQPADWPGKGNQAQKTQPLCGHSRDYCVALGHAGSCSDLERTGNCSCSFDWMPAAWWECSGLGVSHTASPLRRGGPNSRRTNDVSLKQLLPSANAEQCPRGNGAAVVARAAWEVSFARRLPEGKTGVD